MYNQPHCYFLDAFCCQVPYQGLLDDFTFVSLSTFQERRREGADIICVSFGAYGVLLPSTP